MNSEYQVMRFLLRPFLVATLLFMAIQAANAEDSRVMIADSIYIGPDESVSDVVCIACSVQIDGEADDVVVIAGTLVNNGLIKNNAVVIAGSLESAGPISGDAVVIAGNLDLQDEIGNDAIVVMGSIHVSNLDARIVGNVIAVMGDMTGETAETVGGTMRLIGSDRVGQIVLASAIGIFTLGGLVLFIFLLVMTMCGYFILGTQRLSIMSETLRGNGLVCFLLGIGTCFALAVIGMLVAMLLPVSLPIFLLFFVVSVVGYSGLCYGVGRNLFGQFSPATSTLLGACLAIAIQMIPIIGWIILFVFWNIAIGSAVFSGFGTAPEWLLTRVAAQPANQTAAP